MNLLIIQLPSLVPEQDKLILRRLANKQRQHEATQQIRQQGKNMRDKEDLGRYAFDVSIFPPLAILT